MFVCTSCTCCVHVRQFIDINICWVTFQLLKYLATSKQTRSDPLNLLYRAAQRTKGDLSKQAHIINEVSHS